MEAGLPATPDVKFGINSVAGKLVGPRVMAAKQKTRHYAGPFLMISVEQRDLEVHAAHATHAAAALRHAAAGVPLGTSATIASVVIRSAATDAAFWIATRTTLVGSMMPLEIRLTYSPVCESKP